MRGRPPLGPLAKHFTIKVRIDRAMAQAISMTASEMGRDQSATTRILLTLGLDAYREGRQS